MLKRPMRLITVSKPTVMMSIRNGFLVRRMVLDPEVTMELEKLIQETKEKYVKAEQEKLKMETMSRVEFDGIGEGLSSLHFHLTLFLLLVILAVLNVPSVITWANDYQ